jgi:ATP-dependent RNA helicase RhlE
MKTFRELHLIAPLLRAVAAEGYETPTPIQAQAIPVALAGKDLLGCAQTGTGKTAAFALPILQRLSAEPPPEIPVGFAGRLPRALVLTPTRELAQQVAESFGRYGRESGITTTVVYGGVAQGPQVRAVKAGVDVIVATPGRLLDLMEQGVATLRSVSILVLDEADRMLDMGFLPDVYRIVRRVPIRRQTMLFSATLPREIAELAREILHEPVRVEVALSATTVEKVRQLVYHVEPGEKEPVLWRVTHAPGPMRALVFTRTKENANRVVDYLNRGPHRADVMHADRSQGAREKTLEDFRAGGTRVLVATDIASRGLDVEGITHVINYDVPDEPEVYVHRIGRTARAGEQGIAITLCEPRERRKLAAIERAIRMTIPVAEQRQAAAAGHGHRQGHGQVQGEGHRTHHGRLRQRHRRRR